MKALAILGGPPAFPDGLPLARPFTPSLDAVTARLRPSYDSGQLTNGRLVRLLEERTAERLGVDHVVAVSSCTAGLILTIQALELQGPVLLPSFTFSASVHAVAWNNLRPLLADCDPLSLQLDLADAEARLDRAGAIMATHVFGAPCQPSAVEKLAEARGVPAVFDAAHAFGALHDGRPVGGFGHAEVFSLSPTKTLVAGEGGLVATADAGLARTLRIGRDYGNPGDYDTLFVGLNARMSEFHAAVALESLELLDEQLELRRAVADCYCAGLQDLPGITTQEVAPEDTSTYKDFTIIVEPPSFGMTRNELVRCLRAEGIDTRNYFDPPVHRQRAYAPLAPVSLPVTDDVCGRVTSLPMFARLPLQAVDSVVDRLRALHEHAGEVHAVLNATPATPGT
jgi:dTDP-4-amino-4,6-dideoxygalactose transaminase